MSINAVAHIDAAQRAIGEVPAFGVKAEAMVNELYPHAAIRWPAIDDLPAIAVAEPFVQQ